MQPSFTWSDSWLLLSIARTGDDGASLKDILSIGDMLNHAIFTDAELRRGLAKLAAGGHIVQSGERFVAAGAAKQLLQRLRGTEMRDVWNACHAFLGADPDGYKEDPRIEDPNWSHPFVTNEALQEARRQYKVEADDLIAFASDFALRKRS